MAVATSNTGAFEEMAIEFVDLGRQYERRTEYARTVCGIRALGG